MLETPRMKIVRINSEHIESMQKLNLNDIFNDFLKRFPNAVSEAKDKIIKEFAEEYDLSLKCARYFINESFKFQIQITEPKELHETPKMNVVLMPKSVEETLQGFDLASAELNDCDRELLEKHSNDKWEWIK